MLGCALIQYFQITKIYVEVLQFALENDLQLPIDTVAAHVNFGTDSKFVKNF